MRNKKILGMVVILFMSLLIINLVSAEFWACFTKGEEIDFCNPKIPDRTASGDNYKLCMKSFNETNQCWTPGSWNKCNAGGGECLEVGGQIDSSPPEFEINSPIDDKLYTSKKILLEFNLSEKADVYYLDLINGRGRYRRVGNDVPAGYPAYSRVRSFKEGENNLRFRAEDVVGNKVWINMTFYIDTKKPKVHKVEPRNGYSGGEFAIQYTETSLDTINLTYGNEITGIRTAEFVGCESGKKQWCSINVNLDDYHGQEIEYYFTIKDEAGNVVNSRIKKKIKVDVVFPIINDINHTIDGTRVYFTLNVTEDNLDVIEYKDSLDSRDRWRRLCSRLKEGICERRISLRKEGEHIIDIQVIDEAGNLAGDNVVVEIV